MPSFRRKYLRTVNLLKFVIIIILVGQIYILGNFYTNEMHDFEDDPIDAKDDRFNRGILARDSVNKLSHYNHTEPSDGIEPDSIGHKLDINSGRHLSVKSNETQRTNAVNKDVIPSNSQEKSGNTSGHINAQPPNREVDSEKRIVRNSVDENIHSVLKDSPGEMGAPVNMDEKTLSPAERKKYDKGWKDNQFNQYASDMISLHRSLPDKRPPGCRNITYPDKLPDTSVIIIFHNEAWSVLLRTVHSVIDRSPSHLLREVILVDDCSDREHLHGPLQDYVDSLENVVLVRSEKREGLIHARNLGASVAKGDVLTFLDSHCETTKGWLEPLLFRIAQDESNVVCPEIPSIDASTFEFINGRSFAVGGFSWNLLFLWFTPEEKPVDDAKPRRSPTMAGGLFSISRAYFQKLGMYDPDMLVWGGENLELSFKTWMCGGTLEIHPCSSVGHVFRKRSPYSWSIGVDNVLTRNLVRLAEVWLDDYKKYYYERINFKLGDFGDVSERKQLRTDLECKSFDWYIKTIYPDIFIPGEVVRKGVIRNKNTSLCLGERDAKTLNDKVLPCHASKYWLMSLKGEVRTPNDMCLDFNSELTLYGCHGSSTQLWEHSADGLIRHKAKRLCLGLSPGSEGLKLGTCTGESWQKWEWDRYIPDSQRRTNSTHL